MLLLHKLRQMVNQSKFFQRLHQMSKIIIEFSLFYLHREGLSEEDGLNIKPKIAPCVVDFLKPSDMKAISASPEVKYTEDDLVQQLSDGHLCFGIKHHDEIAAYVWANLRQCLYDYIRFDLKEDEAFLLAYRTFSSYRGENLNPYLRVEFYKHLRLMGRTKFIGISEHSNKSALRVWKKLNVKPEKFYLGIKLFMKYKLAILLKSYKI